MTGADSETLCPGVFLRSVLAVFFSNRVKCFEHLKHSLFAFADPSRLSSVFRVIVEYAKAPGSGRGGGGGGRGGSSRASSRYGGRSYGGGFGGGRDSGRYGGGGYRGQSDR